MIKGYTNLRLLYFDFIALATVNDSTCRSEQADKSELSRSESRMRRFQRKLPLFLKIPEFPYSVVDRNIKLKT